MIPFEGFGVDPDASRSAALTVLARYQTGDSPVKSNEPKIKENNPSDQNGKNMPKPEKSRPSSLEKTEISESPKMPIIVSPGNPKF